MSTMGIAVYCGAEREQLMLLRTLQDSERNIIGNNNNNNNNNGRLPAPIAPKGSVSVISVATSAAQPQNENELARRATGQQQQQNNVLPPYDPSRLKKHGKNGQPPPIAVAKRNLRERNRVKQVNNGFAKLRQHIPSQMAQGYGDRGKKLSKVETLRMAVEYIRGLQRLLAEADGLEYDGIAATTSAGDSPLMLASPAGSVYSAGTHNGSGDVLGLTGSELDEQHSMDHGAMDEDLDAEGYLVEEPEPEPEGKDRRDAKRFRDDGRSQNRLAENQNRDRAMNSVRRRRNSPSAYYVSRQSSSFGDEENIEPLGSSQQHNGSNNNNNNLLAGYSPILLQSSSPNSLSGLKRDQQQQQQHLGQEEDECQRSAEDEVIAPLNGPSVILATSSSAYAGDILIESPETGRLVPVKLEDHEASGQLVYVAAANSGNTDGMLPSAYYKHDLIGGPGSLEASPEQLMDVVSWWEQEQGRLVHQLHGQQHHHHLHHHHHHVLPQQHQPTHQQTHQQLAGQQHQRLAHV